LVTSSLIFDANFSGYNSIILSTFGKALLFFTPIVTITNNLRKNKKSESKQSNQSLGMKLACIEKENNTKHSFDYELQREILFKHSILGLQKAFLSNNGPVDLAILTLNGISVWQYEPEKITELINKMLE
jgi:hypothetical protein